MKRGIDLSVVVTAHGEGLLAHKTMMSIFVGLKKLSDSGYSYEILVHIDKGDDITKKYFSRYSKNDNIRIFENSFGDLGMSRNFAAKKARGKYVAFIDADDLYSDNYFIEAVKVLEKSNEKIVVHAEAILSFGIGRGNILSFEKDSGDGNSDALQLVGANKWGSEVVARKETFLECPYRKTENGYGYEDYMLNIDLLSRDVAHKVAKGTVRFYRRTDSSLLSAETSKNTILPYLDLFEFDSIKQRPFDSYSGIDESVPEDKIERIKRNKIYRKIRENKFLNYFITPVAGAILKRRERKCDSVSVKVPDFVIEEWKCINRIETQLYPYDWIIDNTTIYEAESKIQTGKAYYRLAKMVTRMPDYVFIVPWLVRGGGDKVILNYIDALKRLRPEWQIAVVATNAGIKSTWAEKLPDGVDFIEFGEISKGLTYLDRDILMSVFITQLNCKRLHIINSLHGYEWAMRHKILLEKNYKLNVTLFAAEYVPGTDQRAVFAYDDPYLTSIIDVTRMITTDNKAMIKRMMEVDGFIEQEKFKVHYQPVIGIDKRLPKTRFVEDGRLHILWAGRVVSVKMPELVAEIGKRLDPNKFIIDVYGEMGNDVDKNIFDNNSSIRYHGGFDGFDSLPIEDSDILLYTSRSDGIPNIILEATMAGLPIIASDDGGVGEVIVDGKTGILVKKMLEPDEYVEKLHSIKDIDVLGKYVKNAQKLVENRHSLDVFEKCVKEDLIGGRGD